MCGVCLELATFLFLKEEVKNKKLYKEVELPLCYNYAQETSFLKDLLQKIKAEIRVEKSHFSKKFLYETAILHVFCVRVIEDVFLQKKVDYFVFDDKSLSLYFSKIGSRFERFQKALPWLKFWKPLYEKDTFSNLKILENFFSNAEIEKYAEKALNFYLRKFTYKLNSKPQCSKIKTILKNKIHFLYPIFHCSLIYLAEVKKNFDILQKVACCNPYCILDFYGLDLWLRRKAIFYLIDLKGIKVIPELIDKNCEVKYIYFYCLKNPSKMEIIDQMIRKRLSKEIVEEWQEIKELKLGG